MKKTAILLSLGVFLGFSQVAFCKAPSKETAKAVEWFDKGEWYAGFSAAPSVSINKELMAKYYNAHPERWKIVFDYLKDTDLKTRPLGTTELGEGVRVIVQEYTSKDPGDERLEFHKKYIDLQYVVSGKEMMGHKDLAQGGILVVPFNETKDIGFYTSPNVSYYMADASHFFIFFPEDMHIPGIQFAEKCPIRKIVFKVPAPEAL